MRTIDVHAHLMPQGLWEAVDRGESWHGMQYEPGDGPGIIEGHGKRVSINSPKLRFTPEERIADMDADGTDVQVVSIHTPLFPYHWEPVQALRMSREVNDEIAGMTRRWPDRYAGLATLPVGRKEQQKKAQFNLKDKRKQKKEKKTKGAF